MLIRDLAGVIERHPAAIALAAGSVRVTYGDLWQSIAGAARFLRKAGLRRGERVALILDNCPEYVAAMYATFATGGVVVALQAAARSEDLTGWLQHSGARFVFLSPAHWAAAAPLVERGELQAVVVGDTCKTPGATSWQQVQSAEAGASVAGALAPTAVEPGDPALILYTSGTSGRPKGVTLSHGNLAANVVSILDYLHLRAADRMVNVLPFYYSYGNSVLHTHLVRGATLILEPNLVYPHKVVETIVREKATGFAGVPSTFALLNARVQLADYDLGTLRYVMQAGGALPVAVLDRFRAAVPGASFFVMYGQTEATARITYLPPEYLESKRGAVGVPVSGVEIQIRREDGTAAAAGETGAIWVRGPNVMLGYWGDPELTRSVLVDGWLNTADTGYLDADGFLFIAGRRSDIIKTGAHRVQPQDIEATIAELDAVEEAGVVGVDDEILGQVIKAVIVVKAGREIGELEIKAHCRARLASYKVPKYVEFAPRLPRTSTGKLQRHVLAIGR